MVPAMRYVSASLLSLLLLAACGDDDATPDAGPTPDGGVDDSGSLVDIRDDFGGFDPDAGPPDFRVEGLSDGVSAHLDADGVLNLDCETNEDCIAALGYFHARDRFVQMDFRRRSTTGRLSGILNEFAANMAGPVDARNRALYSTRDGEPAEDAMLAAATPEVRGWLDAYARGVNSWIADAKAGRNGAVFPREFENAVLFDYDIDRVPDWEPSDSVATVLALINSLTNNSSFEIRMAERRAEFIERFGDELGEQMFRDLYDTRPDVDSPVIENFGEMASLTPTSGMCAPSANPSIPLGTADTALGPDLLAERIFGAQFFGQPGRQGGFGSNNWVVGPDNSASGNALLANDPHLGMTNPATWYVAQLDSKTNGSGDLHAAGMTFAGLPFVIIGQNEDIAWGATTTVFDMTDVYVEEVSADGNSVTFRGEQVDIIKRMFSIERADGTSTEVELQFVPHHGPILPREEGDPVLSLRWTGNDADTDVNFLADLSRATNVATAQTALRQVTTIGQNWVVTDTAGNIGWFPYNRLPQRPWATFYNPDGVAEAVPWMPLDGRGDYEWESYYDYDDLPQLLNPTQGYIATANNDMTGALADGDPTNETFGIFQINVAAGYRHQRIVDLLEESDAHDADSMAALIADTHSQIGEYITPGILSAAEGLTLSANAQKVVTALTGWNYDCSTGLTGSDAEASPLASGVALSESAGCAAFHVAIREINTATLTDEGIFGERGPNAAMVRLLRGEMLLAGDIYWDDVTTEGVTETRDDIITAALDAAGTFLVENLGENEAEWAWGRIHFLNLRSDVDTASGGIVTEFNETNLANDGGLYTVDVANPGGDYSQTSGASMRLLCEAPSTGVTCTFQLPGGPSAHPGDSSYLSLLPGYISNTPRALSMDIDAAAAAAAQTLELNPPM